MPQPDTSSPSARSPIDGARVVVTGSAGFIGSHTCSALLARGCAVLGIDSYDAFYSRALKQANTQAVRDAAAQTGGSSFEEHEGDITNASEMQRTVGAFRPDLVIHLAARAGVRPSIADPAGYALTNIVGTQSILDAAHRAGCDRIVCASSSSVYGNNPKTPFAESDEVDRPISPYAATKKACELIGFTHHHLTGASVAMLRFFTVFGPRQRPDLAIRLFLGRVHRGEPITMFGDGTTSRDYTYIDDIVAGVIASAERIPAHGYRVWNLGGDHPISLRDLITTIGEVVGREPIVETQGMQPGDVDRTWADLTRSRAELDYKPTTPIRDGIERQLAWMRSSGNA